MNTTFPKIHFFIQSEYNSSKKYHSDHIYLVEKHTFLCGLNWSFNVFLNFENLFRNFRFMNINVPGATFEKKKKVRRKCNKNTTLEQEIAEDPLATCLCTWVHSSAYFAWCLAAIHLREMLTSLDSRQKPIVFEEASLNKDNSVSTYLTTWLALFKSLTSEKICFMPSLKDHP